MYMLKYIAKRLVLMFATYLAIMIMLFVLIKLLPPPQMQGGEGREIAYARWEALGYNKPILTQLWIYTKNILKFEGLRWTPDFGTSWNIQYMMNASEVFFKRLPASMYLNIWTFALPIPFGIALGIYAALKKNKWQDHVISVGVMIFISVPAFVIAFFLQYVVGFRWGWLPITMYSVLDAGGWFTWKMFSSILLPILATAFGIIAGYTRGVRGELTEAVTSEYMLLARAKGLSLAQATVRHALKNALVPIFPGILLSFFSIISGSFILEQVFSIPGVGQLLIRSINTLDYDVFMLCNAFYVFIGLFAGILYDISYRLIDPRIRVGAR